MNEIPAVYSWEVAINSSQKNFSQAVALEIDKEVRKIIEDAREKA